MTRRHQVQAILLAAGLATVCMEGCSGLDLAPEDEWGDTVAPAPAEKVHIPKTPDLDSQHNANLEDDMRFFNRFFNV